MLSYGHHFAYGHNQAIGTLDTNVATKSVNMRQREKIQRVNQTLGQAMWTMDDFHMNLKLSNEGIDPCKGEEMIDIITNAKLEEVFGKRECIGWNPKANDHLVPINYDALSNVYDDVYGHALNNGQFSTIFLKGWLV